MRRREPKTRRVVIRDVGRPRRDEIKIDVCILRFCFEDLLHNRAKLAHLIESDERIDFRQLRAQFVREPLRHAAAHDQSLMWPLIKSALLMRAENRIDRFLLGRIDERTGVHHQHIGLLCVRRDFHSALQNAAEHDLGVDQILGATETDHAHFGGLHPMIVDEALTRRFASASP